MYERTYVLAKIISRMLEKFATLTWFFQKFDLLASFHQKVVAAVTFRGMQKHYMLYCFCKHEQVSPSSSDLSRFKVGKN